MAEGRSILIISDGTNEIDLLQARFEYKSRGFMHDNWVPQIAQWKGDGTWSQSALSDGSQLRYRVFDDTVETIQFKAYEFGQDEMITRIEDLLAMLEKAADYWTTEWSTEPVYLICRATEETNTRYALIKAAHVPQLNDWYAQPFIQQDPECNATMDGLDLIITRGHWQDTIPGNGNCLEIGATAVSEQAYPLVFDGDTSEVDLGSPAALDDIPDFAVAGNGLFQVEAWVLADSAGEGNQGIIAEKSADNTVGFILNVSLTGLQGTIRCAATNATMITGADDWTPDGLWHHLVFSYSEAGGDRRIYAAIDGVWVAAYSSQIASIGNYVSDAGANLHIGNLDNGSRGFDGEIGWLRIWSELHYTVGTDFDDALPPRCPVPSDVTNTAWLGIHEGSGTTIEDLGSNGNDGTAANTIWGDACQATFGNYADGAIEETCDREVFVANKQNQAQLSHVFYLDASGPTYSANLLGQPLPYDLLPSPPAAADIVYFGVQTTVADTGPFCSLVFDLATPAAINITGTAWEYWNGAWVALTVQDSTESGGIALSDTGVTSVHWNQPTDWTTTTINGITGYFVRMRVVTVGAFPTAPTQQNRNIYTVTWPYVDVQSDKVGGGALPNVVRFLIENQSDVDLSTAPVLFSNRMICGLRTRSRGTDFAAYINFSDEQNPTGVTANVSGAGAFANDLTTPTGRKITVTNPVGGIAATITFDGFSTTTSRQYAGTFHAFMRIDQTSGAAGDISFVLQGRNGTTGANVLDLSEQVTPATVNAWEVVDFGNIKIPFGVDAPASELGTFYLSIYVYGDGAADVDLFDFIMVPVDEWAIDTLDPNPASPVALALGYRDNPGAALYYLDVDGGIEWPKRQNTRSVLKRNNTSVADSSVDGWRTIANGKAIAQAHVQQRYWFLHIDTSSNPAIGSQPEVANLVQMFNVQRYLGARGDR